MENGGCHDSLTYVRGQDLASGKMLKRLCGTQLEETPTVVLSPGKEYSITWMSQLWPVEILHTRAIISHLVAVIRMHK